MAKLSVEIVTPERRLVSTQVDEARIPGANGLFGVRPGHEPLLSVMAPGELTLTEGANIQRFFVAGGFAQVVRDEVRVLADAAEPTSQIDVPAAQRRLAEAQAALSGLASSDPRYVDANAVLERERARIAAASAS
ncbi:MAG: ATP synthase F1 subunit epsilon [Myxococcaceae bacterium]